MTLWEWLSRRHRAVRRFKCRVGCGHQHRGSSARAASHRSQLGLELRRCEPERIPAARANAAMQQYGEICGPSPISIDAIDLASPISHTQSRTVGVTARVGWRPRSTYRALRVAQHATRLAGPKATRQSCARHQARAAAAHRAATARAARSPRSPVRSR